jgi:hypothetical protein
VSNCNLCGKPQENNNLYCSECMKIRDVNIDITIKAIEQIKRKMFDRLMNNQRNKLSLPHKKNYL